MFAFPATKVQKWLNKIAPPSVIIDRYITRSIDGVEKIDNLWLKVGAEVEDDVWQPLIPGFSDTKGKYIAVVPDFSDTNMKMFRRVN